MDESEIMALLESDENIYQVAEQCAIKELEKQGKIPNSYDIKEQIKTFLRDKRINNKDQLFSHLFFWLLKFA